MPISRTAARALFIAVLSATVPSTAWSCGDAGRGLGVSRIVEIDASGGPVFGMITKQHKEARFLGPKEAVLTFDDGPLPGVTRAILDTLDQFCTKATFFSVGRMAVAYPESSREILKRGHTLGTHTWSHPMSLPRLGQKQARDQIESGFAAVALAAGQPIAPFFRFPGLNDSGALVQYLAERNIATFTVDVVSNDSYISDTQRLIDRTLAQLEEQNGGIMLFHDIKHQTARALPTILSEMKRRGYRIVHMTSKHTFKPDAGYSAAVAQHVTDKKIGPQKPLVAIVESPVAPTPSPASGTTEPETAPVIAAAPKTPIAQEKPAAQEKAPVVIAAPATIDAVRGDAHGRVADGPVGDAPQKTARKPEPHQQIEVVAGVYPSKPVPKVEKPQAASVPVPPRARAVERSWQETQRIRSQDNGS